MTDAPMIDFRLVVVAVIAAVAFGWWLRGKFDKPRVKPPKHRGYDAGMPVMIVAAGSHAGEFALLTDRQRQALRYGASLVHLGLDRFTAAEFERSGYSRALFNRARLILLNAGALAWVDPSNHRLSVRPTAQGRKVAGVILRGPPTDAQGLDRLESWTVTNQRPNERN